MRCERRKAGYFCPDCEAQDRQARREAVYSRRSIRAGELPSPLRSVNAESFGQDTSNRQRAPRQRQTRRRTTS